MKKMKKLLALLLALLMVFSLLAACGDEGYEEDDEEDEEETEETAEGTEGTKGDETKPEGTQPEGTQGGNSQEEQRPTQDTQDATATPTIPNEDFPTIEYTEVPEHAATLDELDAYEKLSITFTDAGDQVVLGLDNISEDEFVAYLKDEYGDEYVFELKGEVITGYYKMEGDTAFTLSDDADISDLEYVVSYFEDFGSFAEPMDGIQYKYMGWVTAPTGRAHAYHAYFTDDNSLAGYVWFDDATGIAVYLTSGEDVVEMEVTNIDTTNSNIPAYK